MQELIDTTESYNRTDFNLSGKGPIRRLYRLHDMVSLDPNASFLSPGGDRYCYAPNTIEAHNDARVIVSQYELDKVLKND